MPRCYLYCSPPINVPVTTACGDTRGARRHTVAPLREAQMFLRLPYAIGLTPPFQASDGRDAYDRRKPPSCIIGRLPFS